METKAVGPLLTINFTSFHMNTLFYQLKILGDTFFIYLVTHVTNSHEIFFLHSQSRHICIVVVKL